MSKQMQMCIYKPLIADSIVISSLICSHSIPVSGGCGSCLISLF